MKEKHGIPALCSLFIPGSGQCIQIRWFNGLFQFLGMIAAWILIFVLIGFIAVPIMHLSSAAEAYNYREVRK